MAKSAGWPQPVFTCQAQRSTQACVAAIWRAQSASLMRIDWCAASFLPKVSRLVAHSTASASATRAIAQQPCAMPSRSPLKLRTMPAKPPFSGPMRFSGATSTLSKWMAAVSEQRQPILSSLVRETPGAFMSISISEMPPIPGPPVRTAVVR